MAENKMKEVAKLLGVEIGVPFKIKNLLNEFMIDEYGLYSLRTHIHNDSILVGLLCGNHEIEQSILDEVEKRYLEGVLRPFKDKVEFIKKDQNNYGKWIHFNLKEDWFCLPYFEKDSMYKGMELEKEYTLKELGLFQDEKGSERR